ncbi:uncharacterized protein PAC_15180 [Phialocephala subalpina]|uniref:Uncharacterized protein n=1 Tax=Phialocephala subalpina TaxID=576137 RepID=A0A1L7XJQ4_9HELO|nr:uncharacterized protein PAC_15180 [Phialocephala subalpina]
MDSNSWVGLHCSYCSFAHNIWTSFSNLQVRLKFLLSPDTRRIFDSSNVDCRQIPTLWVAPVTSPCLTHLDFYEAQLEAIEPKGETKLTNPTPPNSLETQPKTPQMIRETEGHTFQGVLPPTPSDALPEKAQRRSSQTSHRDPQHIIDRMLALERAGRNPLDELDEDNLLQLRTWRDESFALEFKVDWKSFLKWEDKIGDLGGYEYDATLQQVIVKAAPKSIHEGTVGEFITWFGKLRETGVINQGSKLKLRPNSGFKLRRKYRGYTLNPDLAVSLGDEKVSIVLEVGVSQNFQELEVRAKKWLVGRKGVRLVILIDIEIDTAEDPTPLILSFSTNDSKSNLPYDLETQDLKRASADEDDNFEELCSKMLKWHEKQTSPLVHINKATLHLYRRPSKADDKVVFFENEKYIASNVRILPQDIGLPDNSTDKEIILPLQSLVEIFPTLIKDQAQDVAEERAEKLLEQYELESHRDGTYEPSPSVPTQAVFSSTQVSSEPPRRASGRLKRTMAEPGMLPKSPKKRKGNTTQTEDIGQSFETNSSGVMFHCDLTEGETDQANNWSSTFEWEGAETLLDEGKEEVTRLELGGGTMALLGYGENTRKFERTCADSLHELDTMYASTKYKFLTYEMTRDTVQAVEATLGSASLMQAQESLKELSRRLTYDDLFGDGSGHVVNPDDSLLALREALKTGLEDYTQEQMKATVATSADL